MKVMLIGTSVNADDKQRGNLAGFNHAYGIAFRELGHEVLSYAHNDIRAAARNTGNFDLFLLRDVTVDTKFVAQIAGRSERFGIFTHAEFIQGRTMDVQFFEMIRKLGVKPHHIFYDQPLAAQRYAEVGINIPGTFIGWGANPETYTSEEKDIDVLWLGHNYGERQTRVENLIFPLKEMPLLNVKIHGRGQPDGSLSLPEMFEVLSRAKVVVRLSHKAHWDGGYSGRTIYDALASGCFVVHDWYPTCQEMFPHGVHFCKDIETVPAAVAAYAICNYEE